MMQCSLMAFASRTWWHPFRRHSGDRRSSRPTISTSTHRPAEIAARCATPAGPAPARFLAGLSAQSGHGAIRRSARSGGEASAGQPPAGSEWPSRGPHPNHTHSMWWSGSPAPRATIRFPALGSDQRATKARSSIVAVLDQHSQRRARNDLEIALDATARVEPSSPTGPRRGPAATRRCSPLTCAGGSVRSFDCALVAERLPQCARSCLNGPNLNRLGKREPRSTIRHADASPPGCTIPAAALGGDRPAPIHHEGI